MKKIIIAICLAMVICLISNPVHAENRLKTYIGIKAFPFYSNEDIKIDGINVEIERQPSVDLFVGLIDTKFKLRLELEYFEKNAEFKSFTFESISYNLGGNLTERSFMINLYKEIFNTSKIKHYVGIGVGQTLMNMKLKWRTITKIDNYIYICDYNYKQKYKTATLQLMYGLHFDIIKNIFLDLQYKYQFHVEDDDNDESFLKEHNILAGINFKF